MKLKINNIIQTLTKNTITYYRKRARNFSQSYSLIYLEGKLGMFRVPWTLFNGRARNLFKFHGLHIKREFVISHEFKGSLSLRLRLCAILDLQGRARNFPKFRHPYIGRSARNCFKLCHSLDMYWVKLRIYPSPSPLRERGVCSRILKLKIEGRVGDRGKIISHRGREREDFPVAREGVYLLNSKLGRVVGEKT